MRASTPFREWQKLPRSVQAGLATLFAVMALGLLTATIAHQYLRDWRVGLVGVAIFCVAFPAAGVVISRDWANLKWRFRLVGAVWAVAGVVPLLLLVRWFIAK